MLILLASLPKWAQWVLYTAYLTVFLLTYIAIQTRETDPRSWWALAVIAGSALLSAAIAWLLLLLKQPIADTLDETLHGLSWPQRRQVARVWRPGPVPDDAAVLIASLRLHDLMQAYRLRDRFLNRIARWFIICGGILAVISQFASEGPRAGSIWLTCLILTLGALFLPDWISRRRASRLAELRAAAATDPRIAAAVADTIAPASSRNPRATRIRVALALVFVLVIGALVTAIWFSPHRRACQAAEAAVVTYTDDMRKHIHNDEPRVSPEVLRADSLRLQQLASEITDREIDVHLRRGAELAAQISDTLESLHAGTAPSSDAALDRFGDLYGQFLDSKHDLAVACASR